ncbi:class I SAM-dependent methyltransferase [Saccharomonospora saliphila]|uniref:class I SAM-dependent methyltransferase n=1 Tax=Saccharomonospora saliphila TaxID=369829 RepID=UPI000382E587|nr:class I SAM-dependent methyltransferase [Saccharomonospora saliphila]
MTATPPQRAETGELDTDRVEEFAGRLQEFITGGMLSHLIGIGHRTGLFDALGRGPATSHELAERAGLNARYVREWLGAMATSGIVTYDPTTLTFTLPAEHALCLTGDRATNLAPFTLATAALGEHLDEVTTAFREGGGVPYERFRPRFTELMDGMSRGLFDEQLIDGLLPMTGDLPRRLTEGARVADIGCGTGHSTNLLAAHFPASQFVGYDFADDAVERAGAEAADMGLSNVSFAAYDIVHLPLDPPFDAVFAFDTIHDQAEPARVLRRVYDALAPGGYFVMMDTRAATDLADNLDNPSAPLLYSISTLHCMTVSLAQGGAGLGTVWGEQLARTMLRDAGFTGIEVNDVPDDPLDSLYVCRKPGEPPAPRRAET